MFNKLFKKKNIILNVHGNDIIADRGLDFKNRGRSAKALKICSKVIVPSSYFKEVLMKNYDVREDKIYIFPSGGIDTNIFDKSITCEEAKERLKLDPERHYIGMVSRIERDKGYDILVKAFNSLSESYKDYDLLIIGSGDEDKYLDNLIDEYNLEDRVIRVPFVTQKKLVDYYKAMDLFVLPTKRRSESLSLVGLEAFASKTLSVICTMYGPKEYANKGNSITYNSEDEKDLVEAIDDALKLSDKEKNELIDKAYNKALKYDKSKMSDILKDIFI
jgi:glycosyltransferase involved in cell wall biosynthesis